MSLPQKKLHIWTPCWGKHFTGLLEKALGRSLMWPENANSVKNCIWTIFTTSAEAAELKETAKRIIPSAEIRILTNDRLIEPSAPIGAFKMQGLLKSIRECLDEKTSMLMSTPDFIWADGSIQNMIDESYPNEGQSLCVSIAHMRVLPEAIGSLECVFSAWDSRDLVELGMTFPHDSWVRSEYSSSAIQNGIYHSGVCWRDLCQNLLSVQHQMPSPFLVNFKESDLAEFTRWKGVTPPAFGEWDHNWPTILIDEGRLRYLGSSDLAFMIEVTEHDKNVPPLSPARLPHDQFFRVEPSVKIQKQFISTFRY